MACLFLLCMGFIAFGMEGSSARNFGLGCGSAHRNYNTNGMTNGGSQHPVYPVSRNCGTQPGASDSVYRRERAIILF
ncbi:hypothetical protein VTH06DRAFT_8374 [Thermothelomyces fergusii]